MYPVRHHIASVKDDNVKTNKDVPVISVSVNMFSYIFSTINCACFVKLTLDVIGKQILTSERSVKSKYAWY